MVDVNEIMHDEEDTCTDIPAYTVGDTVFNI